MRIQFVLIILTGIIFSVFIASPSLSLPRVFATSCAGYGFDGSGSGNGNSATITTQCPNDFFFAFSQMSSSNCVVPNQSYIACIGSNSRSTNVSVTDTAGLIWYMVQGVAVVTGNIMIVEAVANSTLAVTSDVVTFNLCTLGAGTCAAGSFGPTYVVATSGVANFPHPDSKARGFSSQYISSNPSLFNKKLSTTSMNTFVVSAVYHGCAWSNTTGGLYSQFCGETIASQFNSQTAPNPISNFLYVPGHTVIFGGQYAVINSTQNNVLLNYTDNYAGYYGIMTDGIALTPPVTTSAIIFKTIPPPYFSIQNWFMTLVVMLGFAGIFLGGYTKVENLNSTEQILTAATQPMDSNTFIPTFLVALFIGGLIALLLNITSWITPTIVMIALMVVLWRRRG